jgi:hypothetical protein
MARQALGTLICAARLVVPPRTTGAATAAPRSLVPERGRRPAVWHLGHTFGGLTSWSEASASGALPPSEEATDATIRSCRLHCRIGGPAPG